MDKPFMILAVFASLAITLHVLPNAIAGGLIPIVTSVGTEAHNYGMSFCADGNSLIFDEKTSSYLETIKTSEMFPQCVYNETVPIYSLPPREIIDNLEITQFTGKITGYTAQTFVDLDCLQRQCRQIVNLDQNTGHVILLWQNDSASLSP